MVLCVIALVVFSFLSVFSAAYRPIAAEAFDCVFRLATLRKCESGLDQRLKGIITSKIMLKNENAARFVFKHFESLSTLFTVIFLASTVYTAYGAYNLFTYGSCDPLSGNCVFSPLVNGTVKPPTDKPPCGLEGFVEFYGAECPYCLKMKLVVEQVEQKTGVTFQKLEVWHNDTNRDIMLLHTKELERDCGFIGVPAFISMKTETAVCGEMTAERLMQFIKDNG